MTKRTNKEKRRLKGEPKFNMNLNEEQKRAKALFFDYDVNFIHGTFGTGKTALACEMALYCFRKKMFNKIVITRPIVRNSIGYLPGDINDKYEPLIAPIVHNFNMLQSVATTEKMIENKDIEILPVDFAKGITYVDSVVIVDEYQDLDFPDFQLLLSRLGRDSKIIFCGSLEQVDKKIGRHSCVTRTKRLYESGLVGFSTLTENHRNEAIVEVLDYLKRSDHLHLDKLEVNELEYDK